MSHSLAEQTNSRSGCFVVAATISAAEKRIGKTPSRRPTLPPPTPIQDILEVVKVKSSSKVVVGL